MPVVTIPAVELMKTGTWDASTGRTTVTPDDFQAIVAAYKDRLIDKPPVKIGHDDSRFQDENGQPPATGDGSPAYGWIANPRVSADGNTLIGDLVGVPEKLASIIPAAFRRRSVELSWGVRTAAGKTYRAVLRGIALLGEAAPAVKNLDDIMALYTAGAVIGKSTDLLVESTFTADVQPAAPVVPDSEPITTDPGGTHMAYPKAVLAALGLKDDAKLADVLDAVNKLKPNTDAAGNELDEHGNPVEKLADGTIAPATPPVVTAPVPAAVQTAATGVDTELVHMTRAQFSALTEGAEAGRRALGNLDAQRRDAIISTALSGGRIHINDQARYRAILDVDEKTGTELLAALTPVYQVTSFGQPVGLPATDAVDTATLDAYKKELGL